MRTGRSCSVIDSNPGTCHIAPQDQRLNLPFAESKSVTGEIRKAVRPGRIEIIGGFSNLPDLSDLSRI